MECQGGILVSVYEKKVTVKNDIYYAILFLQIKIKIRIRIIAFISVTNILVGLSVR